MTESARTIDDNKEENMASARMSRAVEKKTKKWIHITGRWRARRIDAGIFIPWRCG